MSESNAAVLIVDDEPRIYHALRRALHREPYEVLYAPGGEEALAMMAERPIDVLIADQNMPGMQGSVLLARVRQQYPDMIRMMLTGDARLETVVAAVNKGEIYRFFTKPCNEAELIISIRDGLQMRALKYEASRLLDTVRKQGEQIKGLAGSTPAAPGAMQPPKPAAPAGELPPIVLKHQEKPGDKAARGVSQSARHRYAIEKRDIPEEVDKLLDEIRAELERLDG